MKSLFILILVLFVAPFEISNALELTAINCDLLAEQLGVEELYQAYLPHEEKCHEFYQCGRGGAVKSTCGEGAVFSVKTKFCSHIDNTKCVPLDLYLKRQKIKLESFYIEDEYQDELESDQTLDQPTKPQPVSTTRPKPTQTTPKPKQVQPQRQRKPVKTTPEPEPDQPTHQPRTAQPAETQRKNFHRNQAQYISTATQL